MSQEQQCDKGYADALKLLDRVLMCFVVEANPDSETSTVKMSWAFRSEIRDFLRAAETAPSHEQQNAAPAGEIARKQDGVLAHRSTPPAGAAPSTTRQLDELEVTRIAGKLVERIQGTVPGLHRAGTEAALRVAMHRFVKGHFAASAIRQKFDRSEFLDACGKRQREGCYHEMRKSVARCVGCVIDEAEARISAGASTSEWKRMDEDYLPSDHGHRFNPDFAGTPMTFAALGHDNRWYTLEVTFPVIDAELMRRPDGSTQS